MNDVLDTIPYNTKHVYVMGKTKSGCEIYMPVDSYDEDVIVSKKEQLQNKLNEIDRHIERKELFDFEPTPPKRRA